MIKKVQIDKDALKCEGDVINHTDTDRIKSLLEDTINQHSRPDFVDEIFIRKFISYLKVLPNGKNYFFEDIFRAFLINEISPRMIVFDKNYTKVPDSENLKIEAKGLTNNSIDEQDINDNKKLNDQILKFYRSTLKDKIVKLLKQRTTEELISLYRSEDSNIEGIYKALTYA